MSLQCCERHNGHAPTGPPGPWPAPFRGLVERIAFPIDELSHDAIAGDTELLLLDIQDRLHESQIETFRHTVYRLLDEADVQQGSDRRPAAPGAHR
jgi:hypothetical protein